MSGKKRLRKKNLGFIAGRDSMCRSEISVKELANLLAYNSKTGDLTWKVFVSPRATAGKTVRALTYGGRKREKPYYRFNLKGRQYLAHRACFALHFGRWPEGEIDHKNGNGLDNRIENLRDVSPVINHRNQILKNRRNKSGVRGISKSCRKWLVHIGRRKIGSFNCFGQALKARKEREVDLGYINCGYAQQAFGRRPTQ
jgi:hypothetical protein